MRQASSDSLTRARWLAAAGALIVAVVTFVSALRHYGSVSRDAKLEKLTALEGMVGVGLAGREGANWRAEVERVAKSLQVAVGSDAIADLREVPASTADAAAGEQWQRDPAGRIDQRVLLLRDSLGVPRRLSLRVAWLDDVTSYGWPAGSPAAARLALLVAAVATLTFWVIIHRIVSPLQAYVRGIQPVLGLAKGTQMLAHDLRKPLSMVRTWLAGRPQGDAFSLELNRALERVDGMIDDVLEFGGSSPPRLEPSSVDLTVVAALIESLRGGSSRDVSLHYDFRHSRMPMLDGQRMLRVLSNIVTNALQALPGQGRMWFKTREIGRGQSVWLVLTIGNSDSFIPKDKLEEIFEPFVTGRSNGTGLGLAIARKIVAEHGGSVWATSDAADGTEFHLKLPLSDSLDSRRVALPRHARDVVRAPVVGVSAPLADGPCLAVVDDDVFVREAWASQVDDLQVWTFASPAEFTAALACYPELRRGLVAVVSDFYFGDVCDMDGHAFAAELAGLIDVPVVVSSDSFRQLGRSPHVAAYIDKQPLCWAELSTRIKAGNDSAEGRDPVAS